MLNSPVFNEMGCGLVQISETGKIMDANSIACDLFEQDVKGIKKYNILELVKKKSAAEVFEHAKFSKVNEFYFTAPFILPNGRKKTCRFTAKPEYKNGRLSYILATINEVDEKPRSKWTNSLINVILASAALIFSQSQSFNEFYN